jgi:antitoxin component of RelBE/YafQ-DinJ toxin-antitoxin module
MSTLTIRIDEKLKNKAAKQAAKLGVPLTFIVTTALVNFIESPKIIIGEPQDVIVTSDIQAKMDKIGELL